MTVRPPAIEFAGVSVALNNRTVLDRIDLRIGPDEFIGVLGGNGAGKTTLMRAVLGLAPVRAGVVRVNGRPVRRGNPDIGYMPQTRGGGGAGLRLTGWEFVAGAVRGHRWGLPWPGRAGTAEVDRALGLVGARALAARPLANLSGGERQRLLLAQALIGRPRLLLLDEPLISLDPAHQTAIVSLAHDLCRSLGIAVLFSAHELNPLLGALDRVLYLGGGAAALGTVDEVITGPVLSRLYGAPIDVVRTGGRVFVMSGNTDRERLPHHHCGHDHPHGHAHHHDHGHDHEGGRRRA